ncbi:MFS general substrate transporter [Infundibulicybe gibba]|nr:MFS general substrate transporter [Infundibulicybe gibba]
MRKMLRWQDPSRRGTDNNTSQMAASPDGQQLLEHYYTRAFLTSHTPSSIAWIGSFQLMMPFALGIVSGKLFDMGYFRPLVMVGSALFTFSLFMLSLAQHDQYYQVFLSQGLGMGIGIGLTFVPTMSVTVHHFKRRRALASGVVLSGSSAGALVFPISSHLIPSKGFAEGVRATAYIVLGCLVLGNLLVRMPKKGLARRDPPDIKSFFKEPVYLTVLAAALFVYFGLFYPLVYIQLYAVEHNVDPQLAFYSLSIVNGSSLVGRVLGNFLADTYGGWNLQVPCTLLAAASVWAVLGIHNAATLIIVSILYGLSLSFAVLADLAATPNEVGARTGLALGVASLGCLFSAPIQGALLTREFQWTRPTSFAGVSVLDSPFLARLTRFNMVASRSLVAFVKF